MLQTTQVTDAPLSLHCLGSVSFIFACGSELRDCANTLQVYAEAISRLPLPCELVLVNSDFQRVELDDLLEGLSPFPFRTSAINVDPAAGDAESLLAGFRKTSGQAIVLLPPYVQCHPDDIARMLEAVSEGLDYVASRREPRVDGKREQNRSRLFNWLARRFSGVPLHDINSGLRAMRREVLEHVPLYGDMHVFLPALAARQGFRVGEVRVRHLEERVGRRNEGVSIYLRRALDLLTLFFLVRFTHKPFRFFGGIGLALLAAGGMIMLLLGIDRIMGSRMADRPLLVLSTLLIVLGIQTFSLGLIGELIIFTNAGGLRDTLSSDVHEVSANSIRAADSDD